MGLSALGFRSDRVRTLISIATDSSHMVKWDNLVTTQASSFIIGSSLFLHVTRAAIKCRMGSKFSKISPGT